MGGILVMDIASRTGWAHWEPEGRVSSGSVRVAPSDSSDPYFFACFQGWATDLITVTQPVAFGFEAPIIKENSEKRRTSAQTAQRLMGLAAIAQAVASKAGINDIRPFHLATVKKFWTGSGRAEKPDMEHEARRRGFLPQDDNEADALALLHLAIEHMFRLPRMRAGKPSEALRRDGDRLVPM